MVSGFLDLNPLVSGSGAGFKGLRPGKGGKRYIERSGIAAYSAGIAWVGSVQRPDFIIICCFRISARMSKTGGAAVV
jgi:hypothetical protein